MPPGVCERPLLAQEHLQLMGVPMFAAFSGNQVWPHFDVTLTSTQMKSLAGNDACLTSQVSRVKYQTATRVKSGYWPLPLLPAFTQTVRLYVKLHDGRISQVIPIES